MRGAPHVGWRDSFAESDSELQRIEADGLPDADSSISNGVESPCDARR